VALDVGERLNPIRGLRKANKNGHNAAFSEDTCLGVRSACDVTARLLETTDQAFQIMMGARPERVFYVRQQRGRQGHGDLLYRGHEGQECCVRTTVLKIVHTRQSWRWRLRAACCRFSEVSEMMHPPEADHSWFECPLAERPNCQHA
jgi:hypothetical protein